MPYQQTTAVKKIQKLSKRLRIIQGGSSAGKTIAILLILIDIAQSMKGVLISVVSETFPHLKRGAMRDFLSIMEGHGYFENKSWNKTDAIYTFDNGSRIEFFSADQPDKVRGPRRDILFINEVNNVSYETYLQLVIRTNRVVFIDYNPVSEFFIHEEVIPKTDHDFLILTYKDNEGLPPAIVQEIESRRENRNFWQVYGLGLLGESEGRIYKDWALVDEIPHEARLDSYGLDFGYSNDPSAIVAVYYYNGGYVLDQILYQKGMSNKQLADILLNQPRANVIADSAEPKSIDEIMAYGVPIQPAKKGPGSVNQGIQYVQSQRISVTKRSVNIIKEYRNYLWQRDRDNKIINIPEDAWDHTLSAIRYAISSHIPIEQEGYQRRDTNRFRIGV